MTFLSKILVGLFVVSLINNNSLRLQQVTIISRFDTKMTRISQYVKLRVFNSFKKGKTAAATVRDLSLEGIKIDRRTVWKLFKKFRNKQSTAYLLSKGRPKSLIHVHLEFIDKKMEENDELTSVGK